MDEDEILSKITRLLEQGCTMLAAHHDCGAPLFRCKGRIVCPVCSFIDEPSSPTKTELSVPSEGQPGERSDLHRAQLSEEEGEKSLFASGEASLDGGHNRDDRQLDSAVGDLRAALSGRLRDLTAAVQDEQDLDRLKKLLDCLEGLLRVMRSL
jgi:UPF0148 protein